VERKDGLRVLGTMVRCEDKLETVLGALWFIRWKDSWMWDKGELVVLGYLGVLMTWRGG
jgi:hypothetical protein